MKLSSTLNLNPLTFPSKFILNSFSSLSTISNHNNNAIDRILLRFRYLSHHHDHDEPTQTLPPLPFLHRHWLRSDDNNHRKVFNKKNKMNQVMAPCLAEEELTRLRTIGIYLKDKISIPKSGLTRPVLHKIHHQWNNNELVKLKFHDFLSQNMKLAHDIVQDYSQQRPSQELVAKDLHSQEWKFRHIYRGQPRRHLLTTGWSAFVNKKKLVSGDVVLFLRGDDGELRLGIRRAAQLKNCSNFSSLSGQQLNLGSLTDVVNALSTGCAFSVHYNPRVGSSEFIIPIHKFLKSRDYSYSAGMRFRMRFESEDAAERRFTGLIIGVSDVDPVRWPGSKWKCLMVRWDDLEASRLNRISPWEIEPAGSASTTNSIMAASLKRTKIGLPSTKLEFPVPLSTQPSLSSNSHDVDALRSQVHALNASLQRQA